MLDDGSQGAADWPRAARQLYDFRQLHGEIQVCCGCSEGASYRESQQPGHAHDTACMTAVFEENMERLDQRHTDCHPPPAEPGTQRQAATCMLS